MEKDLQAVQAAWGGLRAKKSQMLDNHKSPEGQVMVFGTELRASQAKLADLMLQ